MNKNLVRSMALAVSLTATAFAGAAYGEQASSHAGKRGDADANGVLTRAEAQSHAAAMFARMDANNDGKLDAADREARRAAHFDRLDADKNGQLSRQEFSARPQRPDGAQAGRPEGGKRHGWGGRGHGRGHGMMGRMADANKDGAITQAEFTASATQRFDRLDGNKDGQVTKEERQAARAAMRQEWQNRRAAPAQPGN